MEARLNIDDIDINILSLMQNDAKIGYKDISNRLGISLGTVHIRIKKLESFGIIKDFSLNIKYDLLGYELTAFIGLIINSKKANHVISELEKIEEVIELHHTTGEFHMLAKVLCRNTKTLRQLIIEKVNAIEGIEKTETIISLSELISRKINLIK
ncbi:MAG: Lrp/AsnC ligand binding domain-containing protein [Bacteroidales bacterium]|nr:Lrp/AsnC ligand binding domain-containing protein [Bacteroidales bacterium]